MIGWQRLALTAALITVFAGPASALDVPRGSSADARVQRVAYNEDDVVAIYARNGAATHIVFAPGEEVLDMASGFSDGWEFKSRRNNLYLKPKSAEATGETQALIPPAPGRWDTNLLVTTSRRVYSFKLLLVGDSQSDRAAFRVTFTYPADDAALAAAQAAEAEAKSRLEAPPEIRNQNYTMQIGKRADGIAPTSAYDDGTFTYLRFPNNREIPAVFLVGQERGKPESLVNTHVAGDTLVIHRVAPEFVLRLGRQVVSVFNESFDPDGAGPVNGTTVNGVRRVVLQGAE